MDQLPHPSERLIAVVRREADAHSRGAVDLQSGGNGTDQATLRSSSTQSVD